MSRGDSITAETLKQRLAALSAAALGEIASAMEQIGADVVDEARRSLNAGASQRVEGRASVPGGPPDDPTGGLAPSLSVVPDPDRARVTVAAAAPYAAFLEYGTRHMAARPFLRPAVEAMGDQARERLGQALAQAVRSALGGAA